jgi:hypothetical protein
MIDFCPKPPDANTKGTGNSAFTTIDMRDGTTDHWLRRSDTQFPQKYLLHRLRAFGRQVAPEVREGELKVVEGRLPVSNGVVAHTLVVLAKVDERWEATYSVTRLG